jgi:mannitol-1-phosphate 5-dehydrogenase
MSPTKNRYPVESHKVIIFGAGRIGRSFIGQLFGCNGYNVIFIDIDPVIVDGLNKRGSYRIIIKGEKDEEIIVPNVQAIYASDTDKVANAIATADIMAVSVGKNALDKVIPVMAYGLILRQELNPGSPLDIIIAENMRSAKDFVKSRLTRNLPADYPIDKLVGLVETSIGKMVPFMTSEELKKDPLMIYAEPYNTLILDRKEFKSPIPQIKQFAPKDNIKAWVDNKAFLHNLGHATAAYFGFFKRPEKKYLYEVLDDTEVFDFTKDVMLQSADLLQIAYPDEFTSDELTQQVDDLLIRFRNKALRDTVYRVGQDLIRKLGFDDRFMGAIRLAIRHGMPYNIILKAMSYGFFFKAKDENGTYYKSDIEFLEAVSKDFRKALVKYIGLDRLKDRIIINELADNCKDHTTVNLR